MIRILHLFVKIKLMLDVFKAHTENISRIINFENEDLLLTASSDKYIRVIYI